MSNFWGLDFFVSEAMATETLKKKKMDKIEAHIFTQNSTYIRTFNTFAKLTMFHEHCVVSMPVCVQRNDKKILLIVE